MAWPCISRVCCLARFWNQFDKSDLSVPLTIQNYSDISDQEVRSVTKQVSDAERPPPRGSPPARADAAGTRGSFRARREPSYKPREDYHRPGVPFPSTTQYKQDFKPWPIPKKENFPWISNGGSRVDSGSDSPGRGQETKTSSYRQEYRPWTGVKPAKSAKRNPPAQYYSPGMEPTPRETSYQAAYSGESSRPVGESGFPPAQPHPAPQHTAPHVCSSPNPSSLQPDSRGAAKAEEHLVRTKLPPNPSAVFQSGSRVFNI
ncbi:microtubule-associated protein 6 homolog [Oryzias melastigma]|uniref:MAP6 domain containing 1 n=1 Tax=Oryzias melastigma TaxID=30732 RepID=A0A3B3CT67_ORYME|nr:microtubule-associated protein 6 homolog [Oryzias melastigma]